MKFKDWASIFRSEPELMMDKRMTLNDFEDYLPAKLMETGMAVFYEGNVDLVREGVESPHEARIKGSGENFYLAGIEFSDGKIQGANCTCPAKTKPFCKHIVALLLALRQEGAEDPVVRKFFLRRMTQYHPRGYEPGDAMGPNDTLHFAGKSFELIRKAEFQLRDGRPGLTGEICLSILTAFAGIPEFRDRDGMLRQAVSAVIHSLKAAAAHRKSASLRKGWRAELQQLSRDCATAHPLIAEAIDELLAKFPKDESPST